MRLLYHGTSSEGYHGICREGFGIGEPVWTCSEPGVTYFFDHEKLTDELCVDDLPFEAQVQNCVNYTLVGAVHSAIKHQSTSEDLYVLLLEVDDEDITLSVDASTGDELIAAVCAQTTQLRCIPFEAYICRGGYSPNLRLIYEEVLVRNNEYYESSLMSPIEQEIVNACVYPGVDVIVDAIYQQLVGESLHLREIQYRSPLGEGLSRMRL